MDPTTVPGSSEDVGVTPLQKVEAKAEQVFNRLKDKASPHLIPRWGAFAAFFVLFAIRIFILEGWYLVTYALGIYMVNLLIDFLSPKQDPETEGELPTNVQDEFKPFMRRLPEFKFWFRMTRALLVAFFCTFFKFLDVPVFWPILLMYFVVLFTMTMRRQIKHMIKYRYIPFSFGKLKYNKDAAPAAADK